MTHFSHTHVYTHTQTLMIFFLVILKICLREGEHVGGGAEAENLKVDSAERGALGGAQSHDRPVKS